MNIQPTYVTFEQAKLLKKKEFDVVCGHYYELALTSRKDRETGYSGSFGWKKGELNAQSGYFINNWKETDNLSNDWFMCSMPEQWQVVEWLRVKHGIIIELLVDGWKDDNCVSAEFLCYRIFIWQIGKPKPHYNDDLGALSTPQSAYSAAFDYILKELV